MSKQVFFIGQRWANTAETELGIGIVTQVNDRTISLFFPAAEELRNYAKANAPLTRVQFHPRDTIETQDGTRYKVQSRTEQDGLFFYEAEGENGEIKTLCETQVQGSSQMPEALKRLLLGQLDDFRNFSMRLRTWELLSQYDRHPAKGFMGARVDLIPHQFHIAQTVSARTAPRVMLADEVGLGKTIEAGLIAHQQLISGKIGRVLILVPDSLVHQWLVEMRRRFNMPVRVLDRDQCEALCEQEQTDNPFLYEQLVLCSIQFLLHHKQWAEAALDSPWDLLVVDEAHHLAWAPGNASPAYALVEQFSLRAKGLLLLTATPEKEGPESHFAQLHLLDPLRYADLPAFMEQQDKFNQIALIAEHLIDHDKVAPEHLEQLKVLLSDANSHRLISLLQADTGDKNGEAVAARTLATRLLDQHGTGRALFRNTRASISGFPQRKLTRVRLPNPACYDDVKINALEDALYPEIDTNEGQWLAQDPRVNWLLETLKKRRGEKFLIICHHKDTACALQAHLHFKGGIQCSAFHEDLTLIERDRSAAWFASHEDGAQALICSEIGSEGRNFQFCHNLVMFDLPATIDQLEQRIGRLDRIGQKNDIDIYALYLGDTQQQALLTWYDEGFGAFTKTESSHSVVFESRFGDFIAALQQDDTALDKLVKTTRSQIAELHERFVHGRNRLLEIHSKGDGSVQDLLDAVEDRDDDLNLKEYMEQVFSAYGVEEEDLSDTIILLRPGSSLEHNSFPSLPEDGVSATYQRAVALGREDIEFLSWDHPMVRNAMDMVLTSGKGSSVLSLLKNKQIKEGTVLLEALYIVECPAPAELQIQQVLPPTPVRLLLDPKGRDLSAAVDTATLDKQLKRIKNDLAAPMLKEIQEPVSEMLGKCDALMSARVQQVRDEALKQFDAYWENEARRLQALAQSDAQQADIAPQLAAVAQKREQGHKVLHSQCVSRLDALRIMISVG